ncbi:MAG: CHAD domain-containing protein [Chloroflexota bacterium]|jgi:CHAD domain-containing protein
MMPVPITGDLPIVTAGRHMMAGQLAVLRDYLPDLRRSAEPTAVHESRKAIRRSFTLFKLYRPYFPSGELEPYRKGLRRIMRRLGPSRDLAVFRDKLTAYHETFGYCLPNLVAYWAEEQARIDEVLVTYLKQEEVRKFLNHYEGFIHSEDETKAAGEPPPLLVRHVLPVLIYQRLGTVQSYGEILGTATLDQVHEMRIQFKELRYTLSFFEELLGVRASMMIEMTRLAQDHLGHLNDADVAIDMLKRCICCPDEVALYCEYQIEEIERLLQEFPPLYKRFKQQRLRRRLALSLVRL